jgi:nucleotidyltransferase substrate binding protein (TIGR01987 family)
MNALKEKIDIQPLLRMKGLLKKSLQDVEDELDEMAAVQAFEVSYELAWHALQKVLNQQGAQVRNPRETFRLAAQWGYLEDPEVWFNFGKERNLTSHTYREDILTAIYNLLPKFLQEFEKLITKLQEKAG